MIPWGTQVLHTNSLSLVHTHGVHTPWTPCHLTRKLVRAQLTGRRGGPPCPPRPPWAAGGGSGRGAPPLRRRWLVDAGRGGGGIALPAASGGIASSVSLLLEKDNCCKANENYSLLLFFLLVTFAADAFLRHEVALRNWVKFSWSWVPCVLIRELYAGLFSLSILCFLRNRVIQIPYKAEMTRRLCQSLSALMGGGSTS